MELYPFQTHILKNVCAWVCVSACVWVCVSGVCASSMCNPSTMLQFQTVNWVLGWRLQPKYCVCHLMISNTQENDSSECGQTPGGRPYLEVREGRGKGEISQLFQSLGNLPFLFIILEPSDTQTRSFLMKRQLYKGCRNGI